MSNKSTAKCQTIESIALTQIRPNPLNPRKRFSGPKFDDLVNSIAAKGVLEPVLVRPVKSKKTPFELIFGERRFRASAVAAKNNGGQAGATIPAMIRDIDDAEAFDLMTDENLVREDLTPLEEARAFATYLDKKGPDAVVELSERTGLHPRYIRRRAAVLELPAAALKFWDQGKILYGHLEQLIRVKDNKPALGKCLADIKQHFQWDDDPPSIALTKQTIDGLAPELKDALFDLKAAGCPRCHKNSDVQKSLFDLDSDKKKCLDPKCFKQQQSNHLLANWKKTKYYRANKTTGFRFKEDIDYKDFEHFHGSKIPAACFKCDGFVTIIWASGQEYTEQACIGAKECQAQKQADAAGESGSAALPAGKMSGKKERPTWHGSHFREKFYQAALPQRLTAVPADDIKAYHLALFALLKSNHDLHDWFAVYTGVKEKPINHESDGYGHYSLYHMKHTDIFDKIRQMDQAQVMDAFREAAAQVVLQDNYDDGHRSQIAEYVGLDIGKEFAIDAEYCSKKTKGELLAFARDTGILDDQTAQTYLYENLNKKRGNFASCKKTEFIDLLLKSGVELKGKVPLEIFPKDQQKLLVNSLAGIGTETPDINLDA